MSDTSAGPQARQEFTISLEGGELPVEVTNRIHKALHRAVLTEIADLDLTSSHAIRFINLDDQARVAGATQGIAAEIGNL